MESFFLAETTKYLYLLFDPDNFIHNDGRHGKVWNTAGGRECIIDSGGYVFNTGKYLPCIQLMSTLRF
jgi:mannosidase alpha-like ER degradation enhancer 2